MTRTPRILIFIRRRYKFSLSSFFFPSHSPIEYSKLNGTKCLQGVLGLMVLDNRARCGKVLISATMNMPAIYFSVARVWEQSISMQLLQGFKGAGLRAETRGILLPTQTS